MTPQLEEAQRLLRLARRDETAFQALLLAKGVDFALACFHAQQAVEKAIKAVMCLDGLEYRRTHDLEQLSAELDESGRTSAVSLAHLRRLTPYAVELRYDDDPVNTLSRDEAIQTVDLMLAWATDILKKASA